MSSGSLPPLAIQPIIFHAPNDLQTQPEAVLDAIRDAGFTAVECNFDSAERLRLLLDARGLRHAGPHVTAGQLRDPRPWIEFVKTTGAADICSSGTLEWAKRGAPDYADTIRVLNDASAEFRQHGIHLHYHHHAFEFLEKPDGRRRGLDLLLEGLNPAACDLCVDVAWVSRGGEDPAAFLSAHRDRIGYVHLKDTEGETWRPLGRGVLDWPAIMAAVQTLPHVRWAASEQDSPDRDPGECIRISREFLQSWYPRSQPARVPTT